MAPSREKFFGYRGEIRALLGVGTQLIFVTQHPEGQPSALYQLDLERFEMSERALPKGGLCLLARGEQIYVGGGDEHLYQGTLTGGPLKPFGPKLSGVPQALASLRDDRLALLVEDQLLILSATGAALQTLKLPEQGSALASDPSGVFCAVGCAKGRVILFDCEEKLEYLEGESAKLHEGSISLLSFLPHELRFLSSGRDGRLLSTHARGALEPEERASRSSAHKGAVAALVWGEERFYSGAADKSLKSWSLSSKRPNTQKDGVGQVIDLALVEFKGREQLAVAAEDASLRLFPLDTQGKLEPRSLIIRDAYARAQQALKQRDPEQRLAALKELASYRDGPSIRLLVRRAAEAGDHGLRLKAIELLGQSEDVRAVEPLERLMGADSEGLRRATLKSLRALEGAEALRPLERALEVQKPDVGVEAIRALVQRAAEDEQALARLIQAMDDPLKEVRFAALEALEEHSGEAESLANIMAFKSRFADLRFQAMLRLHQRGMLERPEVRRALRRQMDDQDEHVRHSACLFSLLTVPRLAQSLRALDKDLHRQLHELETFEEEGKSKRLLRAKKVKGSLSEEERRPLFEAMSSRSLSSCILGARLLALLQDTRAFGTLLQLSRDPQEESRVEASKALRRLGDPRALQRLRMMLRDERERVRDAAFTALSSLLSKAPLEAVEAGLLSPYEGIRRRALKLLNVGLKKRLPKRMKHPSYLLLERALNDDNEAVRGEAFKATLNLGVGGGEPQLYASSCAACESIYGGMC